jgi:hypothetical protein
MPKSMRDINPEKRGHYAVAILLYTALSIIFTFPLILNLRSSFYGFPGDTYGAIWGIWWTSYAIFQLHASPLYCSIAGYPFGFYPMYPIFVIYLITTPLEMALGEVAAYNIATFISFPLAGIGMYYLAYTITKDKYASFIGGCIFAFCPYHFAHALHHLSLVQTQWMPFVLAFLLKLKEEKTYKNAIILAIFLCLQAFSDGYYAFFSIILVFVFLCVEAGSNLRRGHFKIGIGVFKLCAVSLAIIGLVSGLTYIYLLKPAAAHSGAVPQRYLFELVIYSLKPWDLFVPTLYHPVFGRYTHDFILAHLGGSNPVEQTVYLGYTPLILSLFALFKRKDIEKMPEGERLESFAIPLFLAIIVVSLAFMMPAYIQVGDKIVPSSLSYLLYQITSIYRVMVRFDVLIMLSVAVLASIGLKYLTKNKVAAVILLALILFEYTPVPAVDSLKLAEATRPGQNFPFWEESYAGDTTVFKIPEVYRWLADQEGNIIIAEYPMVKAPSENESVYYRYLFYQTVHKKRMVNGAGNPEIADLRAKIERLNDSAVDVLREAGVKYVLVHGNQSMETTELQSVRKGDGVTAYKIMGIDQEKS